MTRHDTGRAFDMSYVKRKNESAFIASFSASASLVCAIHKSSRTSVTRIFFSRSPRYTVPDAPESAQQRRSPSSDATMRLQTRKIRPDFYNASICVFSVFRAAIPASEKFLLNCELFV